MKHPVLLRLLAIASVAASFLLSPSLGAAQLLTSTYETQLEAWLGQGNLDFTNIFTKQSGNTSLDFHATVDGKGATFTLMSISGTGGSGSFSLPEQVVGGYNPQSWHSGNAYNVTTNDSDRTAFLYNFSSGSIQKQNLGAGLGGYQTANYSFFGPTFGAGFDLYSSSSLNWGGASNCSYGGTSFGNEIVSGGPNDGSHSRFYIGALEVWSFAPATGSVPDTTGSLGLMGLSLLALAAFRRPTAAKKD